MQIGRDASEAADLIYLLILQVCVQMMDFSRVHVHVHIADYPRPLLAAHLHAVVCMRACVQSGARVWQRGCAPAVRMCHPPQQGQSSRLVPTVGSFPPGGRD